MDSDFTARYLQDPEPPAAKMSAPGGDVGAPDVPQQGLAPMGLAPM